jgi:aryl sulfotransferase
MRVLQIGFPRSGNLWLYRILDGALARAGVERRRFVHDHPVRERALGWNPGGPDRADMDVIDIEPDGCHFRIADRFRERIDDLNAYVERTSHVCTHSPWCETTPRVLERFDRVVYVVRDPRDAIVSLSRYAFSPVMRGQLRWHERTPGIVLARRHQRLARSWERHVGGYLRGADARRLHVVRFEDLVADFDRTLLSLLDHLDLDLDDRQIADLTESVRFEAMQAEAPDHVRRGGAGGWRTSLGKRQERRIRDLAGDEMAALGYLA